MTAHCATCTCEPTGPVWPRGLWNPPPDGWPHHVGCPVTHAARSLANGGTAGLVSCSCQTEAAR
jgi:hypothetical protein